MGVITPASTGHPEVARREDAFAERRGHGEVGPRPVRGAGVLAGQYGARAERRVRAEGGAGGGDDVGRALAAERHLHQGHALLHEGEHGPQAGVRVVAAHDRDEAMAAQRGQQVHVRGSFPVVRQAGAVVRDGGTAAGRGGPGPYGGRFTVR